LPSSSKRSAVSMAPSASLGLAKRPEPPTAVEPIVQSLFGAARSQKMFPNELSADLALFNKIFGQLHLKCRACHAPLALDVDSHFKIWLSGTQVIPPDSQISVLHCPECDKSTCVGCGGDPKLNKHHFFTTLGVVRVLPFVCRTSYERFGFLDVMLMRLLG